VRELGGELRLADAVGAGKRDRPAGLERRRDALQIGAAAGEERIAVGYQPRAGGQRSRLREYVERQLLQLRPCGVQLGLDGSPAPCSRSYRGTSNIRWASGTMLAGLSLKRSDGSRS